MQIPTISYCFIHTRMYIMHTATCNKSSLMYKFNSFNLNSIKLTLVNRDAGEPRELCLRKLRKNRKPT